MDYISEIVNEIDHPGGAYRAARALGPVLELHVDDGNGQCAEDAFIYPCRTIRGILESLGIKYAEKED